MVNRGRKCKIFIPCRTNIENRKCSAFDFFYSKERKSIAILQKFCKIAREFEKIYYLCGGLGEKFRATDALAFISHFTEKTSEIYLGISSIEKQREVGNGIPSTM